MRDGEFSFIVQEKIHLFWIIPIWRKIFVPYFDNKNAAQNKLKEYLQSKNDGFNIEYYSLVNDKILKAESESDLNKKQKLLAFL